MVYVLFGLAVAVLVLAIPFASRRLRNSRVARATAPVITDMPEHEDRQPFAYGGIVGIEVPDEEGPLPL